MNTEFSLLQLVLLAGALQGSILGWLLLTRQANQPANRIFAVLLFLITLHLLLVGFDNRAFLMRFPHLSHLTWLLPALYGPLVMLYLRRISHLAPSFHWREGLFFLPFLAWLMLQWPYFRQTAALKRAYLNDYAAATLDDFGWLNQGMNFIHLFFFGWCILVYRNFRRRLPHYFSDLDLVRLSWLGRFLYSVFAVVVLSTLVFYARKFNWPYLSVLYPWHFLGVVVLIYWMAYQALAQPVIFQLQQLPADPGILATADGLTFHPGPAQGRETADRQGLETETRLDPAFREVLAGQLQDLMEKDRLFLRSELTLQDLTDRLGTNRQYVSEVLNGHFGKHFYDFVNDYRLAEFRRLVADPVNSQFTLLALAFEAGFNSKATFNAVFKKKMGLTPSEFVRLQQK